MEIRFMFDKIPQSQIGYRVKAAREAKKWKQTQLADALGLKDRQSISAIENGDRALKPDELIALSDALERDIEFFLDPFSVAGEAKFSWRTAPELSEQNLDNFEEKASKLIGLLRWLRITEKGSVEPLKDSLRLNSQSTYETARARAEGLVEKLNLGIVPSDHLIDKIEQNLDIPILFVDTIQDSKGNTISGATCHLNDLGVILINRNEPETRRFYDLAHELFHALTWDAMEPDHRESNSYEARLQGKSKRIEQLANEFAAALLMPTKSLEHFIKKNRMNEVKHLAEVAVKLRVSAEALAYRLLNLGWIDNDTVQSLKKERQGNQSSEIPKPFSLNFVKMLHHAIDKGKLSARKAAKSVSMNLTEFGELFTEYSLEVPFELV